MWEAGPHGLILPKEKSTNFELSELEGELNTEEAQIALAKYLQANPMAGISLLTGMEIYPFQDIILRALSQKDFCLFLAGRGLGKSFLGALFTMLYAIFNPGVKIGICSQSFRQSRMIFQTIENWAFSPKGGFLLQCLKGKPIHRPDAWEMPYQNGSLIVSLPLGSGERIRGYRFNVMVIDELLLLTDKVINEVIQPFMAIQADPVMRQKVRVAEDQLISAGKLQEEDRIKFPSNKLIGLTSASYSFEYLYTMYKNYMDLIFDSNAENVSHCIFQFSHEVAPEGLYDKAMVEHAKKTTANAQFQREYMAQFTDDSGGYYSAKKMKEATIPIGEFPCIQLQGNPDAEYILSIDPNYNDAESSDNFAMVLLELNHSRKGATVVHNYALAKSSLKKRAMYLAYLFENFNIVYVICDNAGGVSFFQDIKDLDVKIKEVDLFEHEFDNSDYQKGVALSKGRYKPAKGQIVHAQVFNKSGWIRSANEFLAASIEHKRIMFGAE